MIIGRTKLCRWCWLMVLNSHFLFAQPVLDSLALLQKARSHIDTLCSDRLKGRGYLNNGHALAAKYIQKEFERYGFKPVCASGMTQSFEFPLNLIEEASLVIEREERVPSKDFLPAPHTPPVELQNVKPYYLGYASPEIWEQEGKNLSNRWVVLEEGTPPDLPPTLKDSLKTWYSIPNQIQQAKKYGVQGLIVRSPKLTHSFASEPSDLPVLMVQSSVKVKKIDRYSVKTRWGKQVSQNVVAFQRGKIDSTIVLCAHYDHLGRIGNTLFRGANDNASGTAFLLLLAEQMSQIQPTYNLLWIAFGAEETGLNGSLYHVLKEPCVPLEKIKCVFNFDLLGHGQEGVMVVGATNFPSLYQKLLSANQKLGKPIAFFERPNAPNSDHYPFTLKNIPALFLYTMGGPKYYHDYLDAPPALDLVSFVSLQRIFLSILSE